MLSLNNFWVGLALGAAVGLNISYVLWARRLALLTQTQNKIEPINPENQEEEDDDEEWEDVNENEEWEDDGVPRKMVLVVRTDLKMGPGKIAAQCGHATLGAFKRATKQDPQNLKLWEKYGQAKIVVKAPDDKTMFELEKKAKQSNIVTYFVADAGKTQIAAGSRTVLAVGPAKEKDVNAITGHLKLY